MSVAERPPRVFLSYSHDSEEHKARTLALAKQLRDEGIDANIDQYEQSPPESWPAWCHSEIRKADFVLMICTETYHKRIDLDETPGIGYGVLWESRLIRQYLYDSGAVSNKFVPILLADGHPEYIPVAVRGQSFFRVDVLQDYDRLYRLLTKQPSVPKPELGPLRILPKEGQDANISIGAIQPGQPVSGPSILPAPVPSANFLNIRSYRRNTQSAISLIRGDPIPGHHHIALHCRASDLIYSSEGLAIGLTESAFRPRVADTSGIPVIWLEFFGEARVHNLDCVRSVTKLSVTSTQRFAVLQVGRMASALSNFGHLMVNTDPADELPPHTNAALASLGPDQLLMDQRIREILATLAGPSDLFSY
jgi:hypothetical protein